MTKPQHEQDYEMVRRLLSTEDSESWSALSRLHSEAAKVPGLEADNAALVGKLHEWSDATDDVDFGADDDEARASMQGQQHEAKLLLAQPHPGAALLERLAKAESLVAQYNLTTEWHACCPDMALRTAQLHTAESERDAAAIRHAEHSDTWARALEAAVAERDAERVTHTAFQDAVEASTARMEAKVATIEAQCQEALAQRDEARNLAAQSASDHAQTLDRMEALVKERDAARQEVFALKAMDRAMANNEDWRAKFLASELEAGALRERVATLEAQRVAAGETEHDLLKSIEALHCTLDGVQEGATEREWDLVAAGVERVATLEREKAEAYAKWEDANRYLCLLDETLSVAGDDTDTLIRGFGKRLDELLTAEARVKELTAQLAGARNATLEDAALLCMEVCQNKATGAVLARLFREKKSPPPPAPAQEETPEQESGSWESYPEDADVPVPAQEVDRERLMAALDGTCETCSGNRVYVKACRFCGDSTYDHECADDEVPCDAEVHDLVDQLRATPTPPALEDESVESEDRAIVEEAWDVLEDAGVTRDRSLAEALRRMLAVRPIAPALVEAVGAYLEYLPRCEGPARLSAQGQAAERIRAAYDAAKGGHVDTLDKALVVEVLRAKHDSAEDVASVSEDADSDTHAQQVDLIRETVDSIAEDLGLTLDSNGGGK